MTDGRWIHKSYTLKYYTTMKKKSAPSIYNGMAKSHEENVE